MSTMGAPTAGGSARGGRPDRPPVPVPVPAEAGAIAEDRAWSATAIEDFLGCPLRYWWQRVLRWSTPTTAQQVVGTIVHGMLEDLLALPAHERSRDTSLEMLKASYRREIERFENAHLDRTVVRDGCAAALESYWETEDPGAVVVAPDGLERAVPASLRGLPFVGYVDRLSETDLGLRVTDYKTGSGKPRYWWPKWRQQLLYAAALEYADQPVAEVQLLFLKDARAVTRPAYPAAVSRALADMEIAHEQRAVMVADSVWEARPSVLCGYCDFRAVCPGVKSSAPQPGTSTSDARLVELGLTKRLDDRTSRVVPA